METSNDTRVCEPGVELDEHWRQVFETAFGEQDCDTIEGLQRDVAAGRMLLHKTFNKSGELVCFTLTWISGDIALLAYMATDPNKRSGGYGSRHLKRLIELLKAESSTPLGLFIEIEALSSAQAQLSAEQKKERRRRLSFYQRCGARRVCPLLDYRVPSCAVGARADWEGELLVVDLGRWQTTPAVHDALSTIYRGYYGLDDNDALAVDVLSHFAACSRCRLKRYHPFDPFGAPLIELVTPIIIVPCLRQLSTIY